MYNNNTGGSYLYVYKSIEIARPRPRNPRNWNAIGKYSLHNIVNDTEADNL